MVRQMTGMATRNVPLLVHLDLRGSWQGLLGQLHRYLWWTCICVLMGLMLYQIVIVLPTGVTHIVVSINLMVMHVVAGDRRLIQMRSVRR